MIWRLSKGRCRLCLLIEVQFMIVKNDEHVDSKREKERDTVGTQTCFQLE